MQDSKEKWTRADASNMDLGWHGMGRMMALCLKYIWQNDLLGITSNVR